MPDENIDLREPLFLVLRNGQMSISALYTQINEKGIRVTRQYLSGYLKALFDFGFLKRTSIKPAIVYSVAPDRSSDLYNSVGLCAKSLSSEEPGNVALIILHTILKRPVYLPEIDRCQVRRPTSFRQVANYNSDIVKSRLAELGMNLDKGEPPVEPQPDFPKDKSLEFLVELLRLVFKSDGNAGDGTVQTKLDV